MTEAMERAFGLTGKTALITGGGSGLGLAMAHSLTAAGARVILAGRREEVLLKACNEIGPLAVSKVFDVSRTQDAGMFVDGIAKEYGSLDILINNAGVHCKKPVETVSMEDLQKVMDVHLFGAYALTQAALPHMKRQKGGSIIFISSMSAFVGLTNVTAYAAAKAAVLGLVKTISAEVAAEGVRVNAIVPGFIDTPMFRQATDRDPDRQKKILGHTQMAQYGKPEDIGWAAVYLAAEASKFVTGTALLVDGGCAVGF